MMASRKSEAAAQRPRRASAKSGGMTQFILVGIGIVIVIFAALLLFGGGGKKTAGSQARAAAADTLGGTFGGAKKPAAVKKATAAMNRASREKAVHDSLIAKRHEERLKQGQTVMTAGGRTTRNANGGFTSGVETHVASSPNELRAILTDNTGSRSALVGERRLNVGDDVNGHKIVDVSGDAVKVAFGQNTYTVRVGEKIY